MSASRCRRALSRETFNTWRRFRVGITAEISGMLSVTLPRRRRAFVERAPGDLHRDEGQQARLHRGRGPERHEHPLPDAAEAFFLPTPRDDPRGDRELLSS